MSIKFPIDAQLLSALARWIEGKNYPAAHVADLDLLHASDTQIWQYASQHSYVIVTKDEDFATRVIRDPQVQVLWVRCGNYSRSALLSWFNPLFNPAIQALTNGEKLVEII